MPKIVIIALIGMLILIGLAMKKQHEESVQMRTECEPTDLYVIGDKGHRNRIYDCSGVDLD